MNNVFAIIICIYSCYYLFLKKSIQIFKKNKEKYITFSK